MGSFAQMGWLKSRTQGPVINGKNNNNGGQLRTRGLNSENQKADFGKAEKDTVPSDRGIFIWDLWFQFFNLMLAFGFVL